MARALGHRNPSTVQGWWERETIPARRQREVLALAVAQGKELTAEDLLPPPLSPARGAQDSLLSEIETFLALTGMTATTFSRLATNDRHFVRHLRAGRQVYMATAVRVRTFIREEALRRREAASAKA